MNIGVKREFSYDESLRRFYQCIANETLIIDEENDVKIYPGQIVKIQREKTINSWPIVFIYDVDFDMAIKDDEFDTYFEEFDIKTLEERMSRKEYQTIFELSEEGMKHSDEELYLGLYEDYYTLASERMLESAIDAKGYIFKEKVNEMAPEIVNYLIMANRFSGKYTITDWIKDTATNFPNEYIVI